MRTALLPPGAVEAHRRDANPHIRIRRASLAQNSDLSGRAGRRGVRSVPSLPPSALSRRPRCSGGRRRRVLALAAPQELATAAADAAHAAWQALSHPSLPHLPSFSLPSPPPAAASAASSAASAAATASGPSRYTGWLSLIADPLEDFLLLLTAGLKQVGVPNAQGLSIVLLTASVKAATFPFTKRQVESGMAMSNLQPQVKALRERWEGPDNAEKLNAEISALYKRFKVNPLAGCVPTLATLPVFWGLYRALINGSVDGAFADPFLWVPSLAGPTYDTFPGNVGGTSWFWPLGPDGVPPIGWPLALRYASLPAALVVSQYVSSVLVPASKPVEGEEETEAAQNVKLLTKFLPLMVGYFALTLPAGMGLYWLANNILTTSITWYLREGGGAQVTVPKMTRPKLKLGTARRAADSSAAFAADGEAANGAGGEAGASAADDEGVVVLGVEELDAAAAATSTSLGAADAAAAAAAAAAEAQAAEPVRRGVNVAAARALAAKAAAEKAAERRAASEAAAAAGEAAEAGGAAAEAAGNSGGAPAGAHTTAAAAGAAAVPAATDDAATGRMHWRSKRPKDPAARKTEPNWETIAAEAAAQRAAPKVKKPKSRMTQAQQVSKSEV